MKVRLSFVDVETGAIRSHWTFALSDVFVDQVLPYFDQYALSHRVWSPDGASIALPVVAERHANRSWSSRRMVPAREASPTAWRHSGVLSFHDKCAHYLCITSVYARMRA